MRKKKKNYLKRFRVWLGSRIKLFIFFHISFFSINTKVKANMTVQPPTVTPPEGYDYIAEGQAVIIFPKDHSVFYNNVFYTI